MILLIKTNLPVILLRGIILLPNNELRLEFDNDLSKNIIDVAELFHDNMLLVVNSLNPLEEVPSENDIPEIGVVSKITHKIELPNGKTRVIIKGVNRAEINELLNLNRASEVLESIVTNIDKEQIDDIKEKILIRKLYRELEAYIKKVPYLSNSVLSLVVNMPELDKFTDIVASNLPVDSNRLISYLNEVKSSKRAEMILEDIYKDEEMFDVEKDIDLKVKKNIDDNQKEYLLREKIKYIKEELGDTTLKENEIEELRDKIKGLNASEKIKSRLENELKRYESLNSVSPEISIIRNYLDTMLSLPWNTYTEDNKDLNDILMTLNNSHYGLEEVKNRVIEYLAVKNISKDVKSPIICLVGPPGVGKTTFASAIAQSINRNFVKVSVGGVNDEAEIVGHRRTYLGAMPGRIIQNMKKAKSNNPVFLIDEIDKMTKDIKGDPASALLEILDPEQNKYFSDNFIEEEYDLSQVMFIVTANSLETIPGPLRDRLEIIELSGYTELEKLDIAKRHLIPKIIENHGLSDDMIKFSNDSIFEIIRYYTKEAGVRELERKITQVVRKIITDNVMKNKHGKKTNVTSVERYLGNKLFHFGVVGNDEVGVVNGLAYTYAGGDTIKIEVNYYPGTGNLILTGSLGEVMRESAQIALSYIRSNNKFLGINEEQLSKNDIHIHVPEGAVPKDGPSAGIALTTALISAFTNQKVDRTIAMTGEITLRGNILAIGGLKEKCIGALRAGIKTIFIPMDNQKDLKDIPNEVKEHIQFICVDNYKELFHKLKSI
ncbi:MAG: endopeptidase La [Firmicutes bacterium]|nr:endopeptidase La [Bacillota bacterium]